MKAVKTKILFFIIVGISLCPSLTLAYEATKQRAYQLNDKTALFVIEYAFGTIKNDFYLPLIPQSELTHTDLTNRLGYVILKDGKILPQAKVNTVILSPAPVVGDMYKIGAGQQATFTLVVSLETHPDERDAEYALQVTSLPYYVGADRQRRITNTTLLQNYRTPGVDLNRDVTVSGATHTLILRRP